jgi:abhydrolase domain-containing protein 14
MERFVSVRGLKIRYLENGSGLPVVLLHGFSFSSDTWVEIGLFDELAREYKVYSFDMPYGPKSRSDKFDAADRDEYAAFLMDLLKTLDIHDPLLLGASISGEVVLRYLSAGYGAKLGIVAGPAGVKNLADRVSKIAVPLLAVWGDRDTISAPDGGKIIEARVKNSEVHMIEGAGHACYLDKPEEFKMIVRKFLKKVEG